MTDTAKTVCVVGATGGIGAAAVRSFAGAGCRLVLMDLETSPVEGLAKEVDGLALTIDVAAAGSVERSFAAARESVAVLDVLVLAWGVVEPVTAVAEVTDETWARMMAVNLTGVFLCCRAADGWLRDGGRIVTISSGAAAPAASPPVRPTPPPKGASKH